jgi:hypothetical protein
MLAVAVQLPTAAVADACCRVTDRAPARGELGVEASAGAASTNNAPVADATDLKLTTNPHCSPARTRQG